MPSSSHSLQGPSAAEQELLRQRAARYARKAAAPPEHAAEVIVFSRDQTRYAVPLGCLREIRPLRRWTPIPGASPVVPGVCLYRGEILSLHDLGAWLHGGRGSSRPGWVLIVEQQELRLGLLGNEVFGVEKMPTHQVSPVPLTFGERGDGLQGVLPDGILLLDPLRLFSSPTFCRAF